MVSLVLEVVALVAALFNGESLDLLTKLYYLVAGSGAMLLGFLLLAKADELVKWTYRHEPVAKPPSPEFSTTGDHSEPLV